MNDWVGEFRAIVAVVPREEFPDLAAELARAEMLMRQNMTVTPQPKQPAEGWLTAKQAGDMIGMSRSWCYENRELLGGVHHGGAVRYSVRRIRSYLERGRDE